MTDRTSFSRERLHGSSDLAERIKVRWGVMYRAAESLQRGIAIEHGADILQPEVATARPDIVPVAAQPVVDAAQVGSNIFNLEASRDRRAEAESIGLERLAQQARLNAEEAHRDAAA